jgi:hypothetical protein
MTTATATKPTRKLTSARYPGFAIERLGPMSYRMTRPGGVFAIGVSRTDEHGWEGVLLSRQRGGWEPAKTPYRHSVSGCVVEADRRETTIRKYASKPLGKPTTK